MKEKVLITGGTGLIGREVIKLLQEAGYEPLLLSHSPPKGDIKTYYWNIAKNELDSNALREVDHVIHLAGASVAGKRWTKKYKQEIIDSRVKSAELLHNSLIKTGHRLKSFISASAIGYYGNRGNEVVSEETKPGNDFLSDVCVRWEAAADAMKDVADRVVKLRTGIVLSKEGGALPQIMMPMKLKVSVVFGSGKQYYSWIDIEDMAGLYLFALKNNIEGVFNAVAPDPVTYNELIKAIEKARNISTLKIHFPLWFLKIPLGEFAETIYDSANVSTDIIQQAGFRFQYAEIEGAITNLFH